MDCLHFTCFKRRERSVRKMRYIISGWMILCASVQAQAGSDSLYNAFYETLSDSNRIVLKLKISKILQNKKPAAAFNEARWAYFTADSLNMPSLKARAIYRMGMAYYYQGEPDSAFTYLKNGYVLFTGLGDSLHIAHVLNSLGVLNYDHENPDEALAYFLESLSVKKKINEGKPWIATTLNNIGMVYKDRSDFKASLQHFERALKRSRADRNLHEEAMAFNNMGLLHYDLGHYDDAATFFHRSVAIREEMNDVYGCAGSFSNLGRVAEARGNYEEAIRHYKMANELRVEIGDQPGQARGMKDLAHVYAQLKKQDQAFFYAKNALKMAENIRAQILMRDVYEMLARLCEYKQDDAQALKYYKLAGAVKDTISREKKKWTLPVLKSKERGQARIRKIQMIENQINEHQIAYRRQSIAVWFLVGMGGLVSVLGLWFWRRYRMLQAQSEQMRELSVVASETTNYVLITDKADRVIWVNNGFTNITGYSLEEIQGLRPKAFLREQPGASGTAANLEEAYRNRQATSGEVLNYTKSGKPIWLSFNISPVRNEKNEIEKFVTIGTEVTHQKEDEEKLRKYSSSLEILHSIDSILISNRTEKEILFDVIQVIVAQFPYCDRFAFASFRQDTKTAQLFISDRRTQNEIIIVETGLDRYKTIQHIANGDFYLEQDLTQQENLSDSDQELLKLGIKTYLAYPLHSKGDLIGCLYLGSRTPEIFTLTDLEMIREISKTLSISLIQRKYQVEIQEKNDRITDSIHYAWRIQKATLPSEKSLKGFFSDFFIAYRPRDIVSGDFYWFAHKNERFIVACADCTGHGVPGGFMTMLGMNLLHNIVNEKGVIDPGLILTHLHRGIIHSFTPGQEEVSDGMDISICSFDLTSKNMEFATARHLVLRVRAGEMSRWPGTKLSIGEADHPNPPDFKTHRMEMEKGDLIYLFTDGVADQFGGAEGRKFGRTRFEKLLLQHQGKSMPDQANCINDHLDEWMNAHEQVDDMLVVGLRI